MSRHHRSVLAVVATAAGCSSPSTVATPHGGPRGLHASEHLNVAHEHDELARHDPNSPEVRERQPGSLDYSTAGVPWVRSWDIKEDHERMARIHRSEAATIQAEFDEACGQRSVAEIAVSPLVRYGVGGTNTANGVIVYLTATGGSPDALVAEMRCHRAWMLLAPAANMDDCPLDLPDIKVDAHGDAEGIALTIIETRPSLVIELQRRAAHELEAAAQTRGRGDH